MHPSCCLVAALPIRCAIVHVRTVPRSSAIYPHHRDIDVNGSYKNHQTHDHGKGNDWSHAQRFPLGMRDSTVLDCDLRLHGGACSDVHGTFIWRAEMNAKKRIMLPPAAQFLRAPSTVIVTCLSVLENQIDSNTEIRAEFAISHLPMKHKGFWSHYWQPNHSASIQVLSIFMGKLSGFCLELIEAEERSRLCNCYVHPESPSKLRQLAKQSIASSVN